MMRATLTIALLLALVAPATAASRMPRPADVTVVIAACPGYEFADGCYRQEEGRVYVKRRGDRETRWHEFGHAFDVTVLTDQHREWFTRKFRMAGRSWKGAAGAVSPAEWFAEAYMRCALPRKRLEGGDDAYGYNLTGRRHRDICNAIQILGLISR